MPNVKESLQKSAVVAAWLAETTAKRTVAIATLASLVFCILCGINLTGQGVYYDEAHQAPAAFTWLGKEPIAFSRAVIGGVPLLNMPYSGALKSHLYGLYLRVSGRHFSVLSWRSLGIGFAAVGIFLFCLIGGSRLGIRGLLLFLALLLSDGTVLLTSRHDWGPTALALALRLLFLGIWIRGATASDRTTRTAFVLGAVVGLSIFEKLSSVVLLAPLYLILATRSSRTIRAWTFAHLGLLAGALPLLVANAYTWMSSHALISLTPNPPYPPVSWLTFARHYLALGQGRQARLWILGTIANPLYSGVEAGLIAGICLLIAWTAIRDREFRLSGLCIASYAIVGVFVMLLPGKTYVHHWILGTPFQYLAIALAVADAPERSQSTRRFLTLAAGALLLLRLPALYSTEDALMHGKASTGFDPSFTKLAQFAGRHPESQFVATTWGTGVQMYCLSDGQPDHVFEPFWDAARIEQLKAMLKEPNRRFLYLTELPGAVALRADLTARTVKAVEESAEWQEVPVDPELSNLAVVRVRKFERRVQARLGAGSGRAISERIAPLG